MRVIIGDETGLVKSVGLEANTAQVLGSTTQSRATSAKYLAWTADNDVVIGRANGHVDCVAADGADAPWSFKSEGAPVGMGVLREFGSIVRCNVEGRVEIVHPLNIKPNPASFSVGHDIHTLRVDPLSSKTIAIGGKERDVNLWDLETQAAIFKAKNVTHDDLDMRVPVWVKCMAFLPPSEGHRLVVGTGHHQIRLYDTATKRRPVQETVFGELPITSLAVQDNRVIFGDTAGNINALDLRNMKHLGRYHGPVGAIRDIALHPTLPYMAAVGLDRMVHVYHTETRKNIHTYYAKQRLNAVLFTDEIVKPMPVHIEKSAADDGADDDAEMSVDEDEEEYEGLEIDGSDDDDDEDDEDDDDDDEDMD
ncbi:hypothetical protein SPRG_13146 [Saprolegnia parasitica CBS 223.65]|uniref:Anaphase-promoting complex subunit 4 WD40 domain-containing protein n=1 Tax=Saprolegnia parasitica (strain CBS 223.65) TaxID=695850 RepID=A0A067BY25_SAPPC|nr:hypothetical protein SPRG_13146 [Saprolegnia parasitica CBS 223.65]KDO21730.1 hypothetical protein SPRG_13146 [Saprolegnia parasitica CBS 223.65]|eukprot:XP_012207533.1 hypothetical protein SPRG_13146 [Saprolegnia parasitica CBS 223.65]